MLQLLLSHHQGGVCVCVCVYIYIYNVDVDNKLYKN
jgi:hypothetical protein